MQEIIKLLLQYGESDIKLRNRLFRTFRGRMLGYTSISGGITFVVEMLLMINMEVVVNMMAANGYRSYLIGRDGINPESKLAVLMVLILVGILVFGASFYVLMGNQIAYIQEISMGMRQISEGDLNTVIEVWGEDELASIASDLNQMTAEIRVLIEKERKAEQTKNDLITNVAHDLRTPLTSIIGYLGLLKDNPDMVEELRKQYIEVAFTKSQRLEKLIGDLFGFTKLKHGKVAMHVEKLDLKKLLEQLLDEFYPSFQEKNLEYEFLCQEPALLIEADGNLLARLFDNLINNAIKYGADGKVIQVHARLEQAKVRVEVVNYGYVIPKEEIEHIFQKFYRVEQSRSMNTGGSGLGLAIAKSVVEMHGGTIEAKSSLKGTVFTVQLPVSAKDHLEKFAVDG